MSNSLWEEEVGVDVEAMANYLLELGATVSPSELHGCLTGLLAGDSDCDAESALHAASQLLDVDLHGELAALVMELHRLTAEQLEDEDFDFYPLLPADDVDIGERTRALAAWCRGFLAGFARRAGESVQADAGSAGGGPTDRGPTDRGPTGLSGDSAEILGDFAAIAEAVVGDDEEDEDQERSYMEILEYLRFAALNVYLDSRAEPGRAAGGPAGSGPALH